VVEIQTEIRTMKKTQKKRRATPAQAEAGRKNLLAFLNASVEPPALRHGIAALVKTGQLPSVPGAPEIRENVSELIDAAVVDMGGSDQITSTQRQILESSRLALTIVALGSRYLAAQGLVDGRGKPHGLLSILASYCNVLRLNAAELGLGRRAKDIHTLDSITREYADAAKVAKKEPPADV
jgi:hypothetical protein